MGIDGLDSWFEISAHFPQDDCRVGKNMLDERGLRNILKWTSFFRCISILYPCIQKLDDIHRYVQCINLMKIATETYPPSNSIQVQKESALSNRINLISCLESIKSEHIWNFHQAAPNNFCGFPLRHDLGWRCPLKRDCFLTKIWTDSTMCRTPGVPEK